VTTNTHLQSSTKTKLRVYFASLPTVVWCTAVYCSLL